MTLTKKERQMFANQFRILAELNKDDEELKRAYIHRAEILLNGYTGLYHDAFDMMDEEMDETHCEETHNVVLLFRRIEEAVAGLSEEEGAQLDMERLRFEGFDMNSNEGHYAFLDFLVNDSGYYEHLQGRYLNSHSAATIIKYRSMLEVYGNIPDERKYVLGFEELLALQRHQ